MAQGHRAEFIPSEWLSLDLGAGELGTMALALENPERVMILDDALARRIAQAAITPHAAFAL